MTLGDFSAYNVSVWRLENRGNIEYVTAHNRTIAELEEAYPRSDPGKVHASEKVGLHAEVLAAETVFKRSDVLRGETVITQIFTERTPCSECSEFLRGIPQSKYVPRYFYLSYSDRAWQRDRAQGSWGMFLMDCYRLR